MSEEITHSTIIQWMINGFMALFGITVSLFAGVIGYMVALSSSTSSKIAAQTDRVSSQEAILSAIKQKAEDLSQTIQRIHDEDLMWKADINRRLDAIEERAARAVEVANEIIRKHQLKIKGETS
jgi:cell division protein FtsB